MSFKTSRKTKKEKGRWSKKKREPYTTYSCPVCFTRNDDPPRKRSDDIPYCNRCFAHTSEFVEVKKTKFYRYVNAKK